MGNFVFTSPGYKFRERDLSYVTRNVGITTAGLVGETPQGPAFEEVYIESLKEYTQIFGDISNERNQNGELKYQLGFAAKSFLSESNQLWVTRVLGLSGYEAGNAWGVVIKAGHDPETINFGTPITQSPISITGSTYLIFDGYEIDIIGDGQTGTTRSTFVRNGSEFEATEYSYVVNKPLPSVDGEIIITETPLTANPLSEYDDMVVAILRSKGGVEDVVNDSEKITWNCENIRLVANKTLDGDLFEDFTIEVETNFKNETGGTITETHDVSLNPKHNFISGVLGTSPQSSTDTNIWVEKVYPELLTKLFNEGWGYSVSEIKNLGKVGGYDVKFQTPETPWIVSEARGDTVDRLFKFISISDGDSANRQIKISVQNINFNENTFDIVVRDFYDKDNDQVILESFIGCNLNPTSNSYIGKRIGTPDGFYRLRSKYIMVEIMDGVDINSLPAGFEGYEMFNFENAPQMMFATEYSDINDPRKVRNEYLGITERAYSSKTSSGSGIDSSFFGFMGEDITGLTKGFHLDYDLHDDLNTRFIKPSNEDAKFSRKNIDSGLNPYSNINARKFTLVPAGGFDGWNIYRTDRTNTDNYRKGGIYNNVTEGGKLKVIPTDQIAWLNAIDTFSNAEAVTINLLATPGVNWNKNTSIVQHAIDMVENDRTDTLYIIDSPDVDIPFELGFNSQKRDVLAAQEVVDLLDLTGIDNNYACTYFPWVQVSNKGDYVYIPPTGEVLKSIAMVDKVHYPWFAVAGLNKGVLNVNEPKYRLSQPARDILYKGRINPIAEHAGVGTAIFGQKTLQVKDTALTRINVRRLLLQIKVLISNIAIRMVFEQGDQTLMEQFITKVNPLLDEIRKNRGLLDFRVKMDDENNTPETMDRNELYGEIFLKPTRTIEYIGITFTVTPSGASFEDFGA